MRNNFWFLGHLDKGNVGVWRQLCVLVHCLCCSIHFLCQ